MPEPDDLTGELRRHGTWLDGSLVPVDPADLRQRADGDAPAPVSLDAVEPPRRSRLPILAVAAAVLAVVGVVGALLIGNRGGDDQRVDTAVAPVTGSWTAVPDHIFPDPAIVTAVEPVWTGSEVLLVGALSATGVPDDVAGKGMTPLGPIPAFSPSTGTWRTIAAPPIELPGSGLDVAWTGSELLVMGPPPMASGPTTAAQGAAYDPDTDAWRTIASAPAGRGVGGTGAWATNRMLLWAVGVGVTAYDPQADTWTVLSTEPIGTPGSPMFNSAGGSAVWTGSELVVADGGSAGTAAFDPTSATWRLLPDRPAGSFGAQPIVWTGRVIGSGDVRGPAWMAPGETAWHQATEPTPDHAGSPPAAQVWVGDRFLSWAGAVYGDPTNPRPPNADTAIALDLTIGRWTDAPAPPATTPPYGDAVLAGDRVFTFSVDNDFQHRVGHGTIRAALSSPGFGTGTEPLGPAIAPPATDPESANFCESVQTFISTYQREAAVSGLPITPEEEAAEQELLDRARSDFSALVEQSPTEIRGPMEVLAASLERVDTTAYRPDGPEVAANNEVDDWLKSHCGFTTSNPNPNPVPGSTPDTAQAASTVVGTQVP